MEDARLPARLSLSVPSALSEQAEYLSVQSELTEQPDPLQLAEQPAEQEAMHAALQLAPPASQLRGGLRAVPEPGEAEIDEGGKLHGCLHISLGLPFVESYELPSCTEVFDITALCLHTLWLPWPIVPSGLGQDVGAY